MMLCQIINPLMHLIGVADGCRSLQTYRLIMAWEKQCFLEKDFIIFLMNECNLVGTPTNAPVVLILSSTIPVLLRLLALSWGAFTQPSIEFICINVMLKASRRGTRSIQH
jgi:hypothetical protein